MFKQLLVILLLVIIVSCNKNNNESQDAIDPSHIFLHYKFSGGCSIEKKLTHSQVCRVLKNNESNNKCAQSTRKNLFDTFCNGQVWPHSLTRLVTYNRNISYSYIQPHCQTGAHIFAGMSNWLTMHDFCSSLKNEAVNNYCAKDKRMKEYNSHQCDSFI